MGATHWSTRLLGTHLGISDATVAHCWRKYLLQPWRRGTFKVSTDSALEAKIRDVVGHYLNPPSNAIVLCVDEKSQIQALDRTAPILPIRPGLPETPHPPSTNIRRATLGVGPERIWYRASYPSRRAVQSPNRRRAERLAIEELRLWAFALDRTAAPLLKRFLGASTAGVSMSIFGVDDETGRLAQARTRGDPGDTHAG